MRLDRPRDRLRLIWCVIVVFSAVFVGIGAYRARDDASGTSDFDDFWLTARYDFLARATMTDEWGVHNYLPFFMVFVAPFGALPIKVASVVFNVLSLGAFGLTVLMVERLVLAGGRSFAQLVPWVAVLLAAGFVADCVVLGQMSLFTMALVVLCWVLVEQGRPFSAGVTLALAASLKLFPGLLALHFLLKRQWRVLGGLVVGMAVFNAGLTSLAFGPKRSWELHRRFVERSVRGQSLLTLAGQDTDKMKFTNQSLPVVVRRLTMPTYSGIWDRGEPVQYVNVIELGAEPVRLAGISLMPVQWTVVGIAAALVCVAVWIGRHPSGRITMERQRYEYAGMFLLSLVLSPILWTFYFANCYYALALLAGFVDWRQRERGRTPLAATAVLVIWGIATPILAVREARAAGYHLWATVALLAAMWLLALRSGRVMPRGGAGAEDRAAGV